MSINLNNIIKDTNVLTKKNVTIRVSEIIHNRFQDAIKTIKDNNKEVNTSLLFEEAMQAVIDYAHSLDADDSQFNENNEVVDDGCKDTNVENISEPETDIKNTNDVHSSSNEQPSEVPTDNVLSQSEDDISEKEKLETGSAATSSPKKVSSFKKAAFAFNKPSPAFQKQTVKNEVRKAEESLTEDQRQKLAVAEIDSEYLKRLQDEENIEIPF